MIQTVKKDLLTQIVLGLFVILTIWWIYLTLNPSTTESNRLVFGAIYGTSMSLIGSIGGIFISKHWGGLKSLMGKAITFFSLGLLAQSFGQITFSYYNIISGIQTPYPSLADLGYFTCIPLYICGIYFLSKVSGIKNNIKSISSYFKAILIPSAMLAISYFFFLKDYTFDLSKPLNIFLDLGYPLGQAAYVSLAILTYLFSRKILGGIMKNSIILFIIAFIFQYFADYNFLYQTARGTWINGGYGDYLYLVAYTIMTLGLLQTGAIASKIRGSDQNH
jgi:hypothetical protein